MNDGEKTVTEYYTDNYLITKERKTLDNNSNDFLNQKALEEYSVMKVK
ncbi:MAG: hypothetical protein WDO14_01385 [Bacteroidota bacterium]